MEPSSPPTHSSPDEIQLARWVDGDLTPRERVEVERWFAEHPRERVQWEAMREVAGTLSEAEPLAPDVVKAWGERLVASASVSARPHAGAHQWQGRWGGRSLRPGRLAIGVLLGVFAILLMTMAGVREHRDHSLSITQRFSTVSGQRATIRLQDGSVMMLAPATSVTVASQKIQVSGEAYFAVAPQSARPFVVQTANANVQVLGTRFSVRKYPAEGVSRVVVEDGRVRLQGRQPFARHDTAMIISARMLAQVTDSGMRVLTGISPQDYTGWTRGELVFDKVPLREVVAEVGRVYGTTIRIDDTTLARKTLILELPVAQLPLRQVLDIIGRTVDARYVFDGHSYVLSPGYASTHHEQQHSPFPQPEHQYGR